MGLDFSALNRISKNDQADNQADNQGADALIRKGYTVVEGEPLPFDDEGEEITSPGYSETMEISQLFRMTDLSMFSALYKAGRIELLGKIIFYRQTGSFFAHFRLSPGTPVNQP